MAKAKQPATVKVRLLTDRAQPGRYWAKGDPLEVDAAEAKALIEAGQAQPWDAAVAEEPIETREASTPV